VKKLRVRPQATIDVEESSLFYLVHGSEALSERFEAAVEKTFAWILENPRSGAPRESLSPRLSGLRTWPVRGFEKHLVFYRETEEAVDVVRVLHGARDVEAIVESDE
jgi:toxin ParE1/3/4